MKNLVDSTFKICSDRSFSTTTPTGPRQHHLSFSCPMDSSSSGLVLFWSSDLNAEARIIPWFINRIRSPHSQNSTMTPHSGVPTMADKVLGANLSTLCLIHSLSTTLASWWVLEHTKHASVLGLLQLKSCFLIAFRSFLNCSFSVSAFLNTALNIKPPSLHLHSPPLFYSSASTIFYHKSLYILLI